MKDVLHDIRTAIERDPSRAMEESVRVLKARVPHYTWVGIYLLEGDELVLGPFLGKPSPHTRIPLGRGICGAAATEKATVIVDDVNADPRYLACSIETKSEIVVPIIAADNTEHADSAQGGTVLGEIDIDSDQPAAFGEEDRKLLEAVAALLSTRMPRPSSRSSESQSSGVSESPNSRSSESTNSRASEPPNSRS